MRTALEIARDLIEAEDIVGELRQQAMQALPSLDQRVALRADLLIAQQRLYKLQVEETTFIRFQEE